jgi:transient receptor potential cation channel subfamily A protein 1
LHAHILFHRQAAERGNLDEFIRLYQLDNSRLAVKDTRGRSVSHQAAARNKVNILQYIYEMHGNLNVQDNSKATPLHAAVENDSLEAIEFLLSM